MDAVTFIDVYNRRPLIYSILWSIFHWRIYYRPSIYGIKDAEPFTEVYNQRPFIYGTFDAVLSLMYVISTLCCIVPLLWYLSWKCIINTRWFMVPLLEYLLLFCIFTAFMDKYICAAKHKTQWSHLSLVSCWQTAPQYRLRECSQLWTSEWIIYWSEET